MATRAQIAHLARTVSVQGQSRDIEAIQAAVTARFKQPRRNAHTIRAVEAHLEALAAGKPTVLPIKHRLKVVPRTTGKPFRLFDEG